MTHYSKSQKTISDLRGINLQLRDDDGEIISDQFNWTAAGKLLRQVIALHASADIFVMRDELGDTIIKNSCEMASILKKINLGIHGKKKVTAWDVLKWEQVKKSSRDIS